MELNEKSLWLFDVDNTLIQDVEHPTPFPGAIECCRTLEDAGKQIGILTNVGRLSARQVHSAVEGAGFPFSREAVFTAGAATAAYVFNRNPDARCFVISEGGATEDFIAKGLNVVNNPPIDFVAIGADRDLSFQRLNFATKCVRDGAELLCISGSRDYPGIYLGKEDVYLGERSITAAVEDATGEKATIVGKPLPEIVVETVKTMGYNCDDAVMIGDNPASDIAGGNAAGLYTILVKRNPDDIVAYEADGLDTNPDVMINSLEELQLLISEW
ncbi:MAG: HAD-IIA family hydrolase [Candidatus Thorarchaeota archaeon]